MNVIDIEILEDGTISAKTEKISESVHLSADTLMKELDKLMGGKVTIVDNPDKHNKAHLHAHQHGHAHAH